MQAKTPPFSATMATNLTVDFGNSINDATGRNPSVAVNNQGVVVEVFERENREVWYRVGMVDNHEKSINWGIICKYDTGVQPHVAIDDNLNVVENHKSPNYETLWCSVGKVDAECKNITWGSSYKYDSGKATSIAIYSNPPCVVEVHKSQSHDTLFWHRGVVDTVNKTISWGPSSKYDSGNDPQIAVDASGSIVVENHKSENHGTLWYHVGKFDGSTMYWEPSHKYDNGISPSIAISSNGSMIIECHQSQNHEKLWYHVGRVDAEKKTIAWGSSNEYDSGTSPSIAINDNSTIVEVHEAGSSALAYRVGTVQQ